MAGRSHIRPHTPDAPSETARSLGLPIPPGTTPTEALVAYLARRDVLLVLDNCEHVLDACAALASTLLGACPDVRVLTTSRELLGLDAETVWRLDPLRPEDATRLFVERARRRQTDFVPSPETDADVAGLCRRLDGLPLAIELAAARVGAMSPGEILSAIEAHRVELGARRRVPPLHHETVRATVEWSYQLLAPAEQEAFRGLAVFVGGFDAAAASAVSPACSLDVLTRLVEKSLVQVAARRPDRTRYRLLETVRDYADEQLDGAGELRRARARHLRHYVARAGGPRDGWPSPGAEAFVATLGPDYENVRSALEWSITSDPCSAVALLATTLDLFLMLGQADGRRLADRALDRCAARDAHRARVLISAGVLGMMVGDAPAAGAALRLARRLCAELGEDALAAWALLFLGLMETLDGDVQHGREHLAASRELHRRAGVPSGEARATAVLGLAHLMRGEPTEARHVVERALSIHDTVDDGWGRGMCELYLGIIAASTGAPDSRATPHLRRAVEVMRRFHGGPLLPVALVEQAGVVARREPGKALRVVAAAAALRTRTGGVYAPFYRARADRVRSVAQAGTGTDAARIWADGMRLDMDAAIALAFGGTAPRPRPAPPPAGLSARELEVARLVAEGLPNKAIATRLHLSVRTVETHVRHALEKIGLENRTQLATWAHELDSVANPRFH